MRNLLMAGTAGLFVVFGAASAYAVAPNSPYAIMVPPAAVDGYVAPVIVERPAMVEGRAAYVEPGYAAPVAVGPPAYVEPGYGPTVVYERPYYAPFPFDLLPWNW